MKHIGYEDAVLLLKEIVTDRGPDWVYPDSNQCSECSAVRQESDGYDGYCDWHMEDGCRYFTEQGAPACIVGEFISRTLQPEEYNRLHLEGRVVTEALHHLPIEVDERAKTLLNIAQQRQDTGDSWGSALTKAIDAAGAV